MTLLQQHPRAAALFSVISLADSANCVRLGHEDWWFPAVVAFALAALIKPTQ